MSRALAVATTILTILQSYHDSYVSAQAPTCLPGYSWSFNSKNQSPCTMTVALGGACVNGAFTLAPLQPDFVYLGPTLVTQNSCRCSTVYYSLLSACALCQNQSYLDWSIYDANCSTVYNQVFLDPIPSTILVPHYAYLDVTAANTFNVTAAMSAGGPESSPIPQATSSTILATSTSTSVAATSKKLNVGAIAGGVVGGVAIIGIAAGLIAFIILRRRKPSAPTTSTGTYATYTYGSPETDMKYSSTIPSMNTSGKVYDPNDPTTFPAFPPDAAGGYSTYSNSPQGLTHNITGNATLVGTHTQYNGAQTQYNTGAQTKYTGAPEL